MDTDNDINTGFKIGDIGADYLLEATQVGSYSGDGASWGWNILEPVEIYYKNDLAELSFSLSTIGNPESMRVVFKGNNLSVGGSEIDWYPDNAETSGAVGNYFSYSLENRLQGQGQRPSVSNQEIDVAAEQSNQIILSSSSARGGLLNYKLITPPSSGVLDTLGSVVNYTPNPSFRGTDSFEYVLNNGHYDSSVARVKLSVGEPKIEGVSTGGGSFGIVLQVLLATLILLLRRFKSRTDG